MARKSVKLVKFGKFWVSGYTPFDGIAIPGGPIVIKENLSQQDRVGLIAHELEHKFDQRYNVPAMITPGRHGDIYTRQAEAALKYQFSEPNDLQCKK